ncbi:MAG TPA: helix-turn-helix domain-containing protein [Chitinophagaceae bacterium]
MVTTTEIIPSPVLRPYVRCFAYREFDTKGIDLYRPLPAMHEFLITFNLGGNGVTYKIPQGGDEKSPFFNDINSGITVTGMNDRFNGTIVFNGHYRLFSIQFMPNGFYMISQLPAAVFTNQIIDAMAFLNKNANTLLQQLQESKTVSQMVAHAEVFLIDYLKKSKAKDFYNSIQSTANLIVTAGSNSSIEKLALDANMSIKTFERKFIEQVGASPKLFSRIVRFNKAIAIKMNEHKKSWTSIAQDCGYFDQMHFIKDFKLFTGDTPTTFFKNTPPPVEHFINITD